MAFAGLERDLGRLRGMGRGNTCQRKLRNVVQHEQAASQARNINACLQRSRTRRCNGRRHCIQDALDSEHDMYDSGVSWTCAAQSS